MYQLGKYDCIRILIRKGSYINLLLYLYDFSSVKKINGSF